jgi:peptide deformylase
MPDKSNILPIHVYGDSVLRCKAEEIKSVDAELLEFAEALTRTMYARDGVGLAAPQVGASKRMIVVDPHWARDGKSKEPLVMLNPVIKESNGETETEEGCISLPGIYAKVIRPSDITVSYTGLDNERHTLKLSGYPAVVVQHEYDHLEGVLFIDRLGTVARLRLKLKLKELERKAVDGVNIRGED